MHIFKSALPYIKYYKLELNAFLNIYVQKTNRSLRSYVFHLYFVKIMPWFSLFMRDVSLDLLYTFF